MNPPNTHDATVLVIERLTRAEFAPFGDVIEAASARTVYPINNGTTQRFHDLAEIDVGDGGGRPLLSLFRAQPRALPFTLELLERHPLGSQAFIPLDPALRYLVVVAESVAHTPRAFLASNGQGVNYRKGCWHHPLIALDRVSDFLVVDRGGAGDNCEERALERAWRINAF